MTEGIVVVYGILRGVKSKRLTKVKEFFNNSSQTKKGNCVFYADENTRYCGHFEKLKKFQKKVKKRQKTLKKSLTFFLKCSLIGVLPITKVNQIVQPKGRRKRRQIGRIDCEK